MTMSDDGKHPCPYRGCPARMPRSVLACRKHWALVSPDTKREVYATWKGGDLEAYMSARAEAVEQMNARNPTPAGRNG